MTSRSPALPTIEIPGINGGKPEVCYAFQNPHAPLRTMDMIVEYADSKHTEFMAAGSMLYESHGKRMLDHVVNTRHAQFTRDSKKSGWNLDLATPCKL